MNFKRIMNVHAFASFKHNNISYIKYLLFFTLFVFVFTKIHNTVCVQVASRRTLHAKDRLVSGPQPGPVD